MNTDWRVYKESKRYVNVLIEDTHIEHLVLEPDTYSWQFPIIVPDRTWPIDTSFRLILCKKYRPCYWPFLPPEHYLVRFPIEGVAKQEDYDSMVENDPNEYFMGSASPRYNFLGFRLNANMLTLKNVNVFKFGGGESTGMSTGQRVFVLYVGIMIAMWMGLPLLSSWLHSEGILLNDDAFEDRGMEINGDGDESLRTGMKDIISNLLVSMRERGRTPVLAKYSMYVVVLAMPILSALFLGSFVVNSF